MKLFLIFGLRWLFSYLTWCNKFSVVSDHKEEREPVSRLSWTYSRFILCMLYSICFICSNEHRTWWMSQCYLRKACWVVRQGCVLFISMLCLHMVCSLVGSRCCCNDHGCSHKELWVKKLYPAIPGRHSESCPQIESGDVQYFYFSTEHW